MPDDPSNPDPRAYPVPGPLDARAWIPAGAWGLRPPGTERNAIPVGAGASPSQASGGYLGHVYIDYQGRLRTAVIEAEVYQEPGDGALSVILVCPFCQKGHDDHPTPGVEGEVVARTIRIDGRKKTIRIAPGGADDRLRLTVGEPITCPYCLLWCVRIRDGVATDATA